MGKVGCWAYWVVGPLLLPLCTLSSSPPSSPPSLVSLHEVGGGQLAVYRGCVRWWWSWRVDGNKCAADQAIFGSVTV